MFNIKCKWLFSITLACFTIFGAAAFDASTSALAGENIAAKKKQVKETPAPIQTTACATADFITVKPLDIVANPAQYLNKNIIIDAVDRKSVV